MDRDDEGRICGSCNGSGEGMYDGSTCRSCGGSGEEGDLERIEQAKWDRAEYLADLRDGER